MQVAEAQGCAHSADRSWHLGPARAHLRPHGRARRCGSAIATSTPPKCTATKARWGRACAPPASSAARCSSPPRSGRRTSRRATSRNPPSRASAKLRLSEVDLLLLHWPNPNIPLADTLGALCKVKQAGLARHIGVSNFTVALINEAVRLSSEPLVCNQIEVHPFLDQSKVIAACRCPRDGGGRLQSDRPRRSEKRQGAHPHRRSSTARPPRRSACAIWCSRGSWSFRAPARTIG